VKNVGKPCEGKLHARFDEEGLASPAFHSTVLKNLSGFSEYLPR
jgi:hypothetical protein